MGKLTCKRWKIPFEHPVDLPAHLMKAKADINQRFEFLVEAETLAYCVPGMKMVAVVKELDVGIKWIDCVESMHPTFHTWLLNEQIRDWKEPGPATDWMQRAMAKKMGEAEAEIEVARPTPLSPPCPPPVKKGDWVLVHAAAGGTGLWLVQLLKAVGANIVGTASTQEKVDLARKAGAEHMINYSHEDVKSKVMELTKDAGCIAVFDGVGKTTFDLSLDCLARKGSMVSFGNASGAVPPVTIARLSAKNARLMRPTLFNYIATREEFEHYVDELMDFLTKDKLP
ncbi:NADPH:quinone reductase [Friedmanniomyces endolithicus]|nr:NADPH:quinone reductase [Friedmanniomyces endolithicus]